MVEGQDGQPAGPGRRRGGEGSGRGLPEGHVESISANSVTVLRSFTMLTLMEDEVLSVTTEPSFNTTERCSPSAV